VSFSDDPPEHGKQHSPSQYPGCLFMNNVNELLTSSCCYIIVIKLTSTLSLGLAFLYIAEKPTKPAIKSTTLPRMSQGISISIKNTMYSSIHNETYYSELFYRSSIEGCFSSEWSCAKATATTANAPTTPTAYAISATHDRQYSYSSI